MNYVFYSTFQQLASGYGTLAIPCSHLRLLMQVADPRERQVHPSALPHLNLAGDRTNNAPKALSSTGEENYPRHSQPFSRIIPSAHLKEHPPLVDAEVNNINSRF